jgi:hypothetical protein
MNVSESRTCANMKAGTAQPMKMKPSRTLELEPPPLLQLSSDEDDTTEQTDGQMQPSAPAQVGWAALTVHAAHSESLALQ